jgi:hypothetical protein
VFSYISFNSGVVNFAVAFNNPVALTLEFYKVKEALSVPLMLYQRLDTTVAFIVASHLKDKIPVGTN